MNSMNAEFEGFEIFATISKQGFISNLKDEITPAEGISIVKFEFWADSVPVAYTEVYVYGEASCAECVFYAADDEDVDQSCAVGMLISMFEDELDYLCEAGVRTAYIRRVYVYPEWRRQGFGSWIFDNLACLIYEYCGLTVGAFCVVPRPMVPTSNKEWDYDDDPNGSKFQNMKRIIEKCGYISNDGKSYAFVVNS